MVRRIAATTALLLVVAACGREPGPDVSSDRIVASPLGSPVPTASGDASPTPTGTPSRAQRVTAGPVVTAAPPRTASPSTNLPNAKVKLTRVASLTAPIAMAVRKGDSAFYIAEKGGRIKRVSSAGNVGTTVLDISSQVSTGGEQGLLGLAFSPDGKRLYVNFTNGPGDTVIREYDFTSTATSPRDVLTIPQPFANHNGGNILFGPGGHLYIGMGDGGSAGDPQNNAQNPDSLLGKMLRIDPRASGVQQYKSASSNPYVGKDGRDEIYAIGLRNPWRFSFDRETGDLWIGDVGQGAWEEISFDTGGGGDNYGWRRMEGSHSFGGGTPPSGHHGPIYEYANDGGNCAVTGGYVYRGAKIADLRGAYVFADFCDGRLRGFVQSGGRAQNHRFLGPQAPSLASFGEDANGELYVLSLEGGFFRIDPV